MKNSGLIAASFALPLLIWVAVSYVPGLWQPYTLITDPGGVSFYRVDMLVANEQFASQLESARSKGLPGRNKGYS